MPYWYYDKKDLQNTPSFRDGISNEAETRYRKEGARFIIDIGLQMDLGYNTVATGVVYYHRFYMFHSFRTFPRYITGCCCLLLAGKVEETPKKCRDIIKMAKMLLSEEKFSTFGEDPKEEVMTLERILLQTIKFELQVEHPYGYLLKYAKCLKGDKARLQKMVQMAWTFVNDSLCTTLCLQWEPEVIAVALMFLAGKLSKFEVVDWHGRTPKHKAWWDMFVEDMSTELLEDICHQVLDLYSPQPQTAGGESPPTLPKLQPKIEKKPSCTPPASTSPIAAVAKPLVTPVKTEEVLKPGLEVRTEARLPSKVGYGYVGVPPYPPPYSAPPPAVPPPRPPVASLPPNRPPPPPTPPVRLSVPSRPPPPLPYHSPRAGRTSRFPVNVPPPFYSPHGRGSPTMRPRRNFTPGPPPPRLY